MRSVKEKINNFCEVETREGKILVHFEIRRSKRSKHFRLNLDPIRPVLLTMPWRASEKEAILFLQSKGDWINDHFSQNVPCITLFEYLQKNQFISSHSHKLSVAFGFLKGKPTLFYDETKSAVIIRFDPQDDREAQIKHVLFSFARVVIKEHTLHLAHLLGIELNQVTVRDQLTVWGTCTEDSRISLNWRLLLLAPELHDYIILHELTHLIHFDHSDQFWHLLSQHDVKALAHDRKVGNLSEKVMALGRDLSMGR